MSNKSVLAACPPQPVQDIRLGTSVRSDAALPPGCPHFLAGASASDDYCDYIRPAWLSAAVPLAGRTADDAFLLAGLASAALWWRLRQRDLDLVDRHKMPAGGLGKILGRIAVIDGVLGQHALLVPGPGLDPPKLTISL